jgi:hypothetical protein
MTSRDEDLGELYEFSCRFVGPETEKAVLIWEPLSDEEMWIPLSQVSSMHKGAKGEGTIVVSTWIAKKKGLI